jgi:NADPH-dependent ferric siderophore reductase
MEGTTMATTRFAVTATSWVTPTLRRVHLHSEDLSAFAESSFTDRYVKLVFPKPGVEYPDQIDVRALRGTLPPEDLPDVRTYTALNVDVGAGTIDIDFVVHGDEGIAGPWAQSAAVGDILLANGPGGAYRAAGIRGGNSRRRQARGARRPGARAGSRLEPEA